MNDLTTDSERLIMAGRRLRDDNRSGGRHRISAGSIGRGSSKIKTRHWMRKVRNLVLAFISILVAASVAGLMFDGIGFVGIMAVLLAMIVAIFVFSTFPKMSVPKRAELANGDVRQMVGKTELWLEHQRPALPPPAAGILGEMGVQLDALGVQLQSVDQSHPATREIRKLVGEVLPETVESYRRIPDHLRREKHAGTSPDDQLTQSLGKISREIDSVTRQLAEGSLDDLAIKTRYLEYRYGEGDDTKPLEND